ncbi:MAG: TRAP transporter large permease, partial [Dehalococcoidia bacterium]
VQGPQNQPTLTRSISAILGQQSIREHFIAGIVPGILLAFMLAGYTMFACLKNPNLAPQTKKINWKERIVSLKKVWPILVLIFGILGGIYFGIMTATEAGGIGVIISFIIAITSYRFRWKNLFNSMTEAATLTGMVGLMIIAATVFSYLIGTSGLINYLNELITTSGLSPWLILIAINIVILLLGCVMDAVTILMVSMPLFIPLIIGLGFNPIWFGVLVTVNIEIGLITPPIGLNLFLTSATFNAPSAKLMRGVVPFLAVLILYLAILIAFPCLSLWLPAMMR